MTIAEWSLLLGSILPFVLAVIPWMMRVHAKLAVIASEVGNLCEKLDDAAEENRGIRSDMANHNIRLESHEMQICFINEKIHEME